jgi:hypothetical protein
LADIQHGILRCNGRLPPGKGFSGLFGGGGGHGAGGEVQFDVRLHQEKMALMMQAPEPLTHFALASLCIGSPRIVVYDASTVRARLARAAAMYLAKQTAVEAPGPPGAVRLPQVLAAYQTDFAPTRAECLAWAAERAGVGGRTDLLDLLGRGHGGPAPAMTFTPPSFDFKWQPLHETEGMFKFSCLIMIIILAKLQEQCFQKSF